MGPSRSYWNGTTSALHPEIPSKGNYSFMCVLSIKVPIREKSGNLFNNPRIHIFFGIYIYIERERKREREGYEQIDR